MRNDGNLLLLRQKIEFNGDEALAGAGFQAFQQVLVAGIVGYDEHETRGRFQHLAGALQRQDTTVVGERMQHNGHILARFHNLVEVTYAALTHGSCQRAVHPHGFTAFQQVTTGQIGGGKIVVT